MLIGGSLLLGGVTTEVSFVSALMDTVDRSVYTFTSFSIGAAHPDRYVVACLSTVDITSPPASGWTPDAVDIGGVAATLVAGDSHLQAGIGSGTSMWIAKVPTGTTATITVTVGNTIASCYLQSYRLLHATGIPAQTFSGRGTNTLESSSFPASNAGICIFNVRDNNAGTDGLWSGTASPVEQARDDQTYNDSSGALFFNAGTVKQNNDTGAESVVISAAIWI